MQRTICEQERLFPSVAALPRAVADLEGRVGDTSTVVLHWPAAGIRVASDGILSKIANFLVSLETCANPFSIQKSPMSELWIRPCSGRYTFYDRVAGILAV